MKGKILAGTVVLLCVMAMVVLVMGESQEIRVIRTTDQNWINKLNANDNVLIIVHGIRSHATDVSDDFAMQLAESRGYNKAVVFEYAPRAKELWWGDPTTSTIGGFNLVKIAAEIKSRTENDVGVFGHSQGTVVINRAAYYIHGSWLPWAPHLTPTNEMKEVIFREVIFAGSTIPYDANLRYLQEAIIGETPDGEKALFNCFSTYDIATDWFQMYLENEQIKYGIRAVGDRRNIAFEPEAFLGGSISEHSRVWRDPDLYKTVPQIHLPQKEEGPIIPETSTPSGILTPVPSGSPIPLITPSPPPPWDDGNGGSGGSLGGVDFTDVHLCVIYSNTSIFPDGQFDAFKFVLKAKKADEGDAVIDMEDATELSLNSFFIGLSIPNDKFWVNLNPWEPDRILAKDLEATDVGKILLGADLHMKKDFCKYENPCEREIGEEYWRLLDEKGEELIKECMNNHPTEIKDINNVLFKAATRHWIVPDKVEAYETNNEIYIVNSTLGIYSEPVYEHSTYEIVNQDVFFVSRACKDDLSEAAKKYGRYVKELEEEMILPLVVQEVNQGKDYSDLRCVYNSLALAQWYKDNYRYSPSIFTDFIDSQNLTGLESKSTWSAKNIWSDYVRSFEEGEYHCWKNETYHEWNYIITRTQHYSSGGVDFMDIKITNKGDLPPNFKKLTSEAVQTLFTNEGNNYYFGDSIYVFNESSEAVPEETEDEKEKEIETLGFETLFAIAGLLAVAYMVLKNKR